MNATFYVVSLISLKIVVKQIVNQSILTDPLKICLRGVEHKLSCYCKIPCRIHVLTPKCSYKIGYIAILRYAKRRLYLSGSYMPCFFNHVVHSIVRNDYRLGTDIRPRRDYANQCYLKRFYVLLLSKAFLKIIQRKPLRMLSIFTKTCFF